MKKIFLFILVLLFQNVFADNSVKHFGMNGPVKRYESNSQVYYFDEAGYLTHADRCRPVDIRIVWKECYKHVFDESGNLIKTYIAKTEPPFVEDSISDSIIYTNEPIIEEFYKNKTGKRKEETRMSNGVPVNYYYRKGVLSQIEYPNEGFSLIVKYHCKGNRDSLEKVELIFKKDFYHILDGKGKTLKIYEKSDDAIREDHYSYYEDGRVKQKTMYRKNCHMAWEINNIDCVITYIYDDWKNLVKEEWYDKDTQETSFVEHKIEYYR